MNIVDFRPAWWEWPQVQEMRRAWQGQPIGFIGGCVRDGYTGRVPRDFDMYSPLLAEDALQLLRGAGINAEIYGSFFGRIVATVGNIRFEIATSKERSLPVSFTGAKKELPQILSAFVSTYDFTLNSLFIDIEGNFYDNFGGIDDIKNGRVRFMGDPLRTTLRMPEDILRYFRFYATFGKAEPDETYLAIFRANSELLVHVPTHKRGIEMVKMFSAPRFATSFNYMDRGEIMANILDMGVPQMDWLLGLERIELERNVAPRAARRIAMLAVAGDLPLEQGWRHLAYMWHLPHTLREEVQPLLTYLPYVDKYTDWNQLKISEQDYYDILLMRKAMGDKTSAEPYPG